ncbi:MAG: AsmA family protein [Gammaproteobacteria bacterium]
MIRIIKWIFGIFFTLALIAIVAVIAVTHFLDPNDFKSLLATSVSKQIGHTIDINGELKLSLFPNIAFSAENIEIKNKANFSRPLLAEVQSTSLNIEFKPLLKKQVKVNALQIKGIKVFLEKNRSNDANWISEASTAAHQADRKDTASKSSEFDISIAKLHVEKAQIEYIDQPNNQRFLISDATFKTEHIQPGATEFPVDLAFRFMQQQQKTIKLNADTKLKGQLRFKSLSHIELKNTEASLNLKPANGRSIATTLTGNLIANILTNTFSLKGMSLKVDESLATGMLTTQLADRIRFNFDIHVDKLDLDRYQTKTAYHFSPIATAYAATPTFLPPGLAQQYDISGQLKIDALKVANLRFSDVQMATKTVGRQGFDFSPISAKLYSGQFNGTVYVDLKSNEPYYQFLGQAFKIDLAAFLDDLSGKHPMTGRAQMTFDLRSAGLNQDRFIRSLNGNAKIIVKDGYLEGVDIPYYYQSAQALIKKQPMPNIKDSHRTQFSDLSGTIFAHHGVLANDDLILTAPQFKIKGQGKIFLSEQTLEYAVVANKTNEQGEVKEGRIPAALKIKGPLDNPKVTPDIEAMAKPVIEHEIKKQIDKQINKIFKQDAPLTPAGEGAPTEQPKNLDDKINHEIEKGLKKILKF